MPSASDPQRGNCGSSTVGILQTPMSFLQILEGTIRRWTGNYIGRSAFPKSSELDVQHIETLLKNTRGQELPGTFYLLIVKDLFQEQCGPWEDIKHGHITVAWIAAREIERCVGFNYFDT